MSELAKRDGNGNFVGCWGAMSDFSLEFKPWENDFSEGLYLAGIECDDSASAPDGWTKWTLPAFRFVKIECDGKITFRDGLALLEQKGYSLAGAIQDFTDLVFGKDYICLPIERIKGTELK